MTEKFESNKGRDDFIQDVLKSVNRIDVQMGKITNIDYQTDWILKELKRTNELLVEQNKLNAYLIRLIEHMLEKSDNLDKMREAIRMEMSKGIR